MPNVPEYPKPKPQPSKAIYCFKPGASAADKAHDIAEVEKFIAYIKAKKRGKKNETNN
jgi:hypothetical protein